MPERLIALIAVTILAVAGLLIAFALSLSASSRQFEHALIAQRQAALVEGLARDSDTLDASALRQSLATYRNLIQQERQYLPQSQQQRQTVELQRAAELVAIAGLPADKARLSAMVHAIARDEQREVVQARADLHWVRRNTIALAVLLAVAAIAATLIGAGQLHHANRNLAGEVAARTAELEAVDQSRRLFFAKASHELRTPVTAIRTIAEVALDGGCDAASPLRDIVAQAGFLGHRIEEMLALAMAVEGHPALTLTPCDLAEVVADAMAQAQPYARSIDVGLVQTSAMPRAIALADRRWLTQAILAVIDNGLKFSDPGAELKLALTAVGVGARITIADSGPGVLPIELPRIFDAYYQAEAGRLRGGTGLGLALARWVVEQHGGAIHAENRDEGGCQIVVALPTTGEAAT